MSQENNINWEALAAISTFLAVLVALGLAVFQHFYQNRVRLRAHLATQGRYSDEKKAIIVISNIGLVSETVTRLLIKTSQKETIELQQDLKLPQTLGPHDVIHLDCPYLAHNLKDVLEIHAEDSRGNRWRCNKDSIKNAIKIYNNFIGKRFVYPSMGDKPNEDDIS